jgi:hypothetical protein
MSSSISSVAHIVYSINIKRNADIDSPTEWTGHSNLFLVDKVSTSSFFDSSFSVICQELESADISE